MLQKVFDNEGDKNGTNGGDDEFDADDDDDSGDGNEFGADDDDDRPPSLPSQQCC